MRRIVIELPDDVAEQFAQEAVRQSTSESELARVFLVRQLDACTPARRKLSFEGIIDDPDFRHGADIEDWFASEWASERDRSRR